MKIEVSMKYLLKITLGLIVGIGLMASCDDDDDNAITGFSLDKEDITVGPIGGTDRIQVSSGSTWVATASEPWIMISPANGVGSTECEIVVDSTLKNDMRTAVIRFMPEGQPMQTVKVYQTGFDKMISFEKKDVEIEASAKSDDRYFETKVTTNVEFKIEIDYVNESGETVEGSWLESKTFKIELDAKARPRTAKLRFDWKMNPDPEVRIAKVKFVPTKEEDALKEPVVLTVTQKAAPKIEDNRSGDSLAIIMIRERLNCYGMFDTSENMMNWEDVTLWEASDEDLPEEEAIGRIRSASFVLLETKESIPQEVHYLKYVEKLYFYSNANTSWLSIDLGSDICGLKHLKDLTIGAYGLVSLPDDFVNLGNSLERLDIGANNFSSIPSILTKQNFPKLKSLHLTGMRRWDTVSDLRNRNDSKYENGIGLYLNLNKDNGSVKELFLWDTLEELSLSYCFIEGQLPELKVGDSGANGSIDAYTNADVTAFGGDTIQWLADYSKPKVLPKMKRLSINLNFLTGDLPDWIMDHPHLLDWNPEALIFNQMEKGLDSEGKNVGFANEPKNFEFYYAKFPLFRNKYELAEESTED